LEREVDGGEGVDIVGSQNADELGGVGLREGEGYDRGEGRQAVGAVVDREIGGDAGDGEVGKKGVEPEGALGADGVGAPEGVGAYAVVEHVARHAVGHVDVVVPRAGELARTVGRGKAEGGVVEIGCEGAGLETAVEGEDAEVVVLARIDGEGGGTEVGGVEPSPHGVEREAGGAHADAVAHDVGVGAGVPAEAEAAKEGVDGAKAEAAGSGGDIVLEEEAGGVGGEEGVGELGKHAVADGVGTDDAAEGVEIVGGEECGKGGKGLLSRITALHLVVQGLGDAVPAEATHMVVHYGNIGEAGRGDRLGMGATGQQGRSQAEQEQGLGPGDGGQQGGNMWARGFQAGKDDGLSVRRAEFLTS